MITETPAARLDHQGAWPWIRTLLERGEIRVPIASAAALRRVLLLTAPPAATLPDALSIAIHEPFPTPIVSFQARPHDHFRVNAVVSFDYDGTVVTADDAASIVATSDPHVAIRRRTEVGDTALDRLHQLGVSPAWDAWGQRQVLQTTSGYVQRIARTLLSEGWHVEHDGHGYLLPSTDAPVLSVQASGEKSDGDSHPIDWFDLRGEVQFGSERVALPRLLAALERGERVIALRDGSLGVLPDSWRETYGPLAMGTHDGDTIRFSRAQTLLLDALLTARPDVSWDGAFARMRAKLESFDRIEPVDAPPTFAGTLRGYQREGLGWLTFLREFGFGGCLADDMGLGKTVMVLALLERQRLAGGRTGESRRTSLVVAPRSVVFNWQQEAARFAPELRVLDYSGVARADQQHLIADSDLVLVTYGTLRRDAERLATRQFEYVILDEAQTIKNAGTASARAARLLRASHRLALSGTPIENRLGDLWSLFEFLNPGLLSASSSFAKSFGGKDVSEEALRVLSRGLRPFILRRTKEQVARELPAKTEQTIECELEKPQRALYNELRDHYRRQLLNGSSSWQRSKLQVLEALLRLRQAACHPGLIDQSRPDAASAKLDVLVPRLQELVEEGHKVIVFSQFTTFLGLLRPRLDEVHLTYEYLDGRTRDREARVRRFQETDCPLFLVSLKAGGLGLNLTAAEYVFLLDPWWNPAVEAQAIDRAHRIGQRRPVFAFRLIARDTVEEKVLELQASKRNLADAIVRADESLIRDLRKEDLELLLA
jgi:superfamily II DNA or RNA helicase